MRLTVIILAFLFLAGCSSPSAAAPRRIGGFAEGVRLTTQNVSSALEEVDQIHWHSQVDRAVLSWSKKPVSPWSLKPFLSPQEVAARTEVLEGLETYAAKLNEIMGTPALGEFDDTARAVGQGLLKLDAADALRVLPGEVGLGVGADDLGPLGASVHMIGAWLVRGRREQDVKSAVVSMKPHVRTICELLAKDIGDVGSGSVGGHGLRAQLAKDYKDLVTTRDAWIRSAKLEPAQLRVELTALYTVARRAHDADDALRLAQRSLLTLVDAHDRLGAAFDNNAPELENVIGQLVADARKIRDSFKIGGTSERP